MSNWSCSFGELIYDEACVKLKNAKEGLETWLYAVSSDCVACPYTRVARISSDQTSVKFNTAKYFSWRVVKNSGVSEHLSVSNRSNILCEFYPRLEQFGLYELTVNDSNCELEVTKQPSYPYTPLFIVVGVLLVLLTLLSCAKRLLRTEDKQWEQETSPEKNVTKKKRVMSLDTFRGLNILLMIFINDGAGGYAILEHTTWNGLLFGDLVFPGFLWIMGVCIPISLSSQLSRGASRCSMLSSIFRRSVFLFLIGVALNTLGTESQLETIRVFGVLQRFSISYLVVAGVYTLTMTRKPREFKNVILRNIMDVLLLFPQWVLMLAIVAGHYAITFYLPVPGCPKGYLGPGGMHLDGKYANCTGGATGYVDKLILGSDHLYQRPAIASVYGSGAFDPEGILGCLTSIFNTFLGVVAGQILKQHKSWTGRVIRWLLWSLVFGAVGYYLHFDGIIPVNKNLWSLSFVLVSCCFAFATITGFYLLIDVARVWNGGPFRVPGMNALVMYIGHQLCYQIFPFHWKIGSMDTHGWLLIETTWGVALWTIIGYVLHRKKIYITL